jgi:hypothetical protein
MAKKFVTIVSGLPRSGTSMMMRMLEAGGMPVLTDNIRQADEDNPNGYYEFEPVKQLRRDTSWLVDAYGKALKMVYLLLYDLPKEHAYKVIFMRRKLKEVIASQNRMLQRQDKQGRALYDAQVARVFRDHLQKLDIWIQAQNNFEVLYTSYNDLIDSPEEVVHRVDQFLGHRLDKNAMLEVINPLLYRQRY